MLFGKETGVSRYVKLMMNSRFPVSELLNTGEFTKYLGLRGFSVTNQGLEYFDKCGLMRPALRLKRPKLDDTKNPYSKFKFPSTDIFALQYYSTIGLVEFPVEGDFQPWSTYIKNDEEIWLFYHPYQILQIDHFPFQIFYPLKGHKLEILDNKRFLESVNNGVNQ